MLLFLYILELSQQKYYVGITGDITVRMGEHRTGRGSQWTSHYEFVDMIHARSYTGKNKAEMEDLETETTITLMREHGISNVRGGKYTHINLSPQQIAEIKQRGQFIDQIDNETDSETDNDKNESIVQQHNELPSNNSNQISNTRTKKRTLPMDATRKREYCCSRCGRPRHTKATCHFDTDRAGKSIGINMDLACHRCFHYNHKTDQCFAKKDRYGNMLTS
jgi:predicted GIY-YIG superfamily endonuclease